MKKIYTTILGVFALVAITNAQTVTYDMADGSYDLIADNADLNPHPDWKAEHNTNVNSWVSNGGADEIYTGINFAGALITNPIIAASGKTITVKTNVQLGYNNQTFDASNAAKNILLIALKSNNSVRKGGSGSGIDWNDRDGLFVQSNNQTSVTLINTQDTDTPALGGFDVNPSISAAAKNTYEVTLTYVIGADAASSSKSCQIRNLSAAPNDFTSVVGTRAQLEPGLYSAITGTGAYYFTWAQTFVQAGGITRMVYKKVTVTVDTTLGTSTKTAFEFSTYPNPVKDMLHINTKEPLQKVEVYDLLGKNVLSVKNVSEQINVSSLSKSLYILKLTSANGVSTKKFLKE